MDSRMQHCGRYEPASNRREFLSKAGAGLGMLALADLMARTVDIWDRVNR